MNLISAALVGTLFAAGCAALDKLQVKEFPVVYFQNAQAAGTVRYKISGGVTVVTGYSVRVDMSPSIYHIMSDRKTDGSGIPEPAFATVTCGKAADQGFVQLKLASPPSVYSKFRDCDVSGLEHAMEKARNLVMESMAERGLMPR